MTKRLKSAIRGTVAWRRTRRRYLAERGGARGMQSVGHLAGEWRGAGGGARGGARGQTGRRRVPKAHNHDPPLATFLFRVGRGVTTSHDDDYITSTTLTIVLCHLNNIDNCTTSPQQHRQLYYVTSTTSTIILRHLNNIDNHTTLDIRITPELLCHLNNINNHIPLDIRIMPEQLTYDTTTNKLYKLSTYTAKGTLLPSPPISLTHSLSILVSAVSYHAHILTRYIRFPF